jgi:hypothetical protein
MLIESLPKAMAARIKLNIDGNFNHASPFELIELIQKHTVGGSPVMSDTARKILDK